MSAVAGSFGQKSYRYLSKNLRYLAADPRFFWMKTFARFERLRELAGRSDAVPAPAGESEAFVSAFGLAEIGATLRDDGYFVGLSLRPEVTAALVARAAKETCYAERDPQRPLVLSEHAKPPARPLHVASYFSQQEDWDEFRLVRDDPWLTAIAHAYLGREPVYLRSELAWSFPKPDVTRAERVATAQVFHCDINDFRTLKFFFYLSDVGLGGGPHAYVKKQPRPRTLRHQAMGQRVAAIDEAALLATYADNEVVTVCGPAGTGFIGDPYYFHRGTTPTETPRLLMQLELGCRRFATWYEHG
ncbi:MAG: hypothetical protein ABW252_13620 [Polyangiales bacterium]